MTVRNILIGAHPWVYAAGQPGHDIVPILDCIFADMAFAGMDGIELMHTALLPENAVDRIRQLSEQHALSVIGTSFGGNLWDRDEHGAVLSMAELVVPRLAQVGGRTLGTSVGRTPEPKTEDQLDAQADVLRTIRALCDSHGVVVNLHNHTYEVENGLHDLRGTLDRIPDIGLGPDLNWLLRGGVDPVAFLRDFSDNVVFLHLRDQFSDGRWSEALGEGDMDYAAIGQTLCDIDFAGEAVIELAHEGDFQPTRELRDSLRMSREYVSRTLGV